MARTRAIAVAMANSGKGIRLQYTRLAVTRGAQNRDAAPGQSHSQDAASRRLFLGRQAAPRAPSPCRPMEAPGSASQGRNMGSTGEAVILCAMPRECWGLRPADPIGDPRPDVDSRGNLCGRPRLQQSGEENEQTRDKGEGCLVLGDFLPPSGLHPPSCDGLVHWAEAESPSGRAVRRYSECGARRNTLPDGRS